MRLNATNGLDINGLNYGVNIGHGLKTNFLFADAILGYILDPKNNLRLESGATYRKESNSEFNDKRFFTIG